MTTARNGRARLTAWLRAHGAFIRYVAVGGFNTLLDIGLYTTFTVAVRLQPLVSNVLSTTITLCVSYVLNRFFVFRSDGNVARTFLQFVTVTCFSGLVVQSAVIWVIVHLGASAAPSLDTDLVAVIAKVCATAVGMVSNYLGYRWLFRRPTLPG